MSRHITLDARISIHFPSPADIVIGLEDDMFDEILKLGLLVLYLVGEDQTGEASADGRDAQSPLVVCGVRGDGDADFFQAGGCNHGR